MTDAEIVARLNQLLEKHPKLFSEYDATFVQDNRGRKFYTDKQREVARAILAKVESDPKRRADTHGDMWAAAGHCDQCLDGLVILILPLGNEDRSRWFEKRGSYRTHPIAEQYRERAFPCTCEQGQLRQQWQKYPRSARDAWIEGWRTIAEYRKPSTGE